MRKWPRPVRLIVGFVVLFLFIVPGIILEVIMGPFAELLVIPPGLFFMYLNPELF